MTKLIKRFINKIFKKTILNPNVEVEVMYESEPIDFHTPITFMLED